MAPARFVQAAGILERMLSERGIGHIVRADAPASGMSVLSIRRGPDRLVPQPGGVLDRPRRSP